MTGKSVGSSIESLQIAGKLGDRADLKIEFKAPPQLDKGRAYELARLQMLGFFYLLTYEPDTGNGHTWPGGFFPIHGTIKSDWGNPVHRTFMKETTYWDYRLVLNGAGGYYRAAIRRHPSEECWSWAVEWNDAYRLVGLFGHESTAQAVADLLPNIPVHVIRDGSNRFIRYRSEEPLAESEDTMFFAPEDEA